MPTPGRTYATKAALSLEFVNLLENRPFRDTQGLTQLFSGDRCIEPDQFDNPVFRFR